MTTLVVVSAIALLAVALVVAVAIEPGPPPSEVAVAYELAMDRHDAQTLWNLSGSALRSDRDRRGFVAAARSSLGTERVDVVREVVVEDEFTGTSEASVLTRVRHLDGTQVMRRTRCVKEQGGWRVQSVTTGSGPEAPERDASRPS